MGFEICCETQWTIKKKCSQQWKKMRLSLNIFWRNNSKHKVASKVALERPSISKSPDLPDKNGDSSAPPQSLILKV